MGTLLDLNTIWEKTSDVKNIFISVNYGDDKSIFIKNLNTTGGKSLFLK